MRSTACGCGSQKSSKNYLKERQAYRKRAQQLRKQLDTLTSQAAG